VSVAAGASWPAAGDDIYAASDHNEVWAGTFNFGFQGTPAAPCNLWCIPAAGDLTAGPQSLASDPYSQVPACAQLATTGSFNLAFASGNINVYGWVFSCGTGAAASTLTFNQKGRMERCSLRLPATLGGTMTLVTGDSVDCSVALGNTSSQVRPTPGARSRWVGGTAPAVLIYSGAVAPLALVGGGSNGEIILDGLDLSNLGAGTTLLQGSTFAMRQVMQNCKINPAATMSSVPTDHAQTAEFVNCQASGGAVSYLQARHRYSGLMLTSAAVYRTGGATLPETGVGISWQIATTANAKWLIPFEAPAMAIWNGTVGAPVKVTIYGNGPAVPNNDEIWCEVEYLGDAATSLASVAHNTKTSYLAAAAPQLSDASAWTGGNTAFRLEVTVTPQRAGYLYVRVKAARPGTTYYIDRKPVLS
jgi:hypothetical protein